MIRPRSARPQVLEWDRPDVSEFLRALRPSWMDRGACRTSDVTMFPADGMGVIAAKAVCAKCPVKGTCLGYALEHNIDHGIWGEKSERQRRALRRGSRAA